MKTPEEIVKENLTGIYIFTDNVSKCEILKFRQVVIDTIKDAQSEAFNEGYEKAWKDIRSFKRQEIGFGSDE
ncbi:MAG: hypothetical protein K9J13_17505 [Saprospiraceae bacterium]|nr:hypothetical protein [Saprospiraceae bacterium]